MNRREAKKLVGTAWLDSDYRIQWETRIMRRRVPLYKAGIAALRLLNNLTGGPNRPSLQITTWERVAPKGGTFVMEKLETMTGRTDHPVTSRAELRARTSFASRLARAISADEWPQIIREYENRKKGEKPQYHYVGHRPLNRTSHELMDKAWVKGELPTDKYRAWVGDVKYNDPGAFYSEFFTHGNARGYPGGETNPGFRLGRIECDVDWKAKASLQGEIRVLRRSRVLRSKELVKFLGAEAAYVVRRGGSREPTTRAKTPPDVYTREVVAAISDFVKPSELRSPTARGETEPDRIQANANDLANTVARALPPPTFTRESEAEAAQPEDASPPRPKGHQNDAGQPPAHRPGVRPPTPPGRSPRDGQSR